MPWMIMSQTLESLDGILTSIYQNEGILMTLHPYLKMKISTQTSWSNERNLSIANKEALNGH